MKGTRVSTDKHLFRRGYGPPTKNYLNPDGSATSRAYKLREKDMGLLSVDVKELTTPELAVKDIKKFVLFEIPVSSVEKFDLISIHDPLPENIAHAYIEGLEEEDEIKPGLLAKAS